MKIGYPKQVVWLTLFLITLHLITPLHAQNKQDEAVKRMQQLNFVNIATLEPKIHIDLMYTRADNFTGHILYTDITEAYLHPQAAKALAKAQKILKEKRPELNLKVYDATRPMHVQQKMWNIVAGTPLNIYVSNPANGGGLHNYGLAVDVTLCTEKGDTIPMGTKIDYLGKQAHINNEEQLVKQGALSNEALENRKLLRAVMREAGYKTINSEWWHFNYKSRAEAKANYKVIP